jgi:hypothetical protein
MFFESTVRSVLCTVTIALAGTIAILTFPYLFRTGRYIQKESFEI